MVTIACSDVVLDKEKKAQFVLEYYQTCRLLLPLLDLDLHYFFQITW